MSAAPPSLAGVAAIRAAFPALDRQVDGRPVAYFDGPGGTQVPRPVGEAMVEYLYHHNANTHWEYPTSHETDAMLVDARQVFAAFLGATPDEIVFGANMTTLTFHVARGLGRAWGPGDEIVVTELDHQANVAPWEWLARERGVVVRRIPFHPEDGTLDHVALHAALARRPRLVAIGAASNALGTVNDLAQIGVDVKASGALFFVDAVHFAAHGLPDRRGWDADVVVCSPYKFYGPHLGVLAARKDLLDAIEIPRLAPAPDTAPERLETGTQCHEAIAGAAAAVRWLASLGGTRGGLRDQLGPVLEALHERSHALFDTLWNGLGAIPGVRRYGPPAGPGVLRTPTAAWTVAGVPSGDVARRLAAEGVFVSHGDFYASTVVERLGLGPEGLVRAGMACYSTGDEVERLLQGVERIAAHPSSSNSCHSSPTVKGGSVTPS